MALSNPTLTTPWIEQEMRTVSKIDQQQCREMAWTTHLSAHYDGWSFNITHVVLEHPERTIQIWAPLACRRSQFLERCLSDKAWDGRVTCSGVLDHHLALHQFIVEGYYSWHREHPSMHGDVRLSRKIAEPLFHAHMFQHLALWEIKTGMNYAFTRFQESIKRTWNNNNFGILVTIVHNSPSLVPLQKAINELCNEHSVYLAGKPDFMQQVRKIPGFVTHTAEERMISDEE